MQAARCRSLVGDQETDKPGPGVERYEFNLGQYVNRHEYCRPECCRAFEGTTLGTSSWVGTIYNQVKLRFLPVVRHVYLVRTCHDTCRGFVFSSWKHQSAAPALATLRHAGRGSLPDNPDVEEDKISFPPRSPVTERVGKQGRSEGDGA